MVKTFDQWWADQGFNPPSSPDEYLYRWCKKAWEDQHAPLRDYFAAAALTGWRTKYCNNDYDWETISKLAFQDADAMLAECERKETS